MPNASDRPAAQRLARAIASDLLLYNDEAVRAGRSLAKEIAEGRALFLERFDRTLLDVYERTVAELLPASARTAAPTAPPPAAGARGVPPADLAAAEEGTRRTRAALFVLGILLIAAAVGVWLTVRW